MKKLLFAVFIATLLSACGSVKVYNNALKQIELGMTKEEVVSLMGKDYVVVDQKEINNSRYETIEYKDFYKNHWFFDFVDNSLNKWYKETETK
jgi:ribosomal protein L19E